MYTKWTQHLSDPKEKADFEKEVLSCKFVFERLKEMLNEQKNEFERSEASTKVYDLPNWDYRQAHANGYKQCLNNLLKLVDLDQQNIRK